MLIVDGKWEGGEAARAQGGSRLMRNKVRKDRSLSTWDSGEYRRSERGGWLVAGSLRARK